MYNKCIQVHVHKSHTDNRGYQDCSAGTVLLHKYGDLSSDLQCPHWKLAWQYASVTSVLGKQRQEDSWEEFRVSLGKILRPCLKMKITVVAGGWGSSVIESFLCRHEALGSILRRKKEGVYME